MTPLEILTGARALIADRGRWTRCTDARRADGQVCPAESPEAVSWCIVGAMIAAGGPQWSRERALARSLLLQALAVDPSNIHEIVKAPLTVFNDAPGRTHAEVIGLLDKVIGALS